MNDVIANHNDIPEDYRHAFLDDPADLTTEQLAKAINQCCSRHEAEEVGSEMRDEITRRADLLMAEFRTRQES